MAFQFNNVSSYGTGEERVGLLFNPQANKDGRFVVSTSEGNNPVQEAMLSTELREKDATTVLKMARVGYFTLSRFGTEWTVKYTVRGNGGGPGLAGIVFLTSIIGGAALAKKTADAVAPSTSPAHPVVGIGAFLSSLPLAIKLGLIAFALPTP